MKYFKDGPIGLWIVSVSIIIFTIYYYIRPFLEGVDVSTVYSPMLEFTLWGFILWINFILEIISIYAVTYGFYYKKNWARLYTIAFNCLSVFLIRPSPARCPLSARCVFSENPNFYVNTYLLKP